MAVLRVQLEGDFTHLGVNSGAEEAHVLLDAVRLHPPLERRHLRLEHHGEPQLAIWLHSLQTRNIHQRVWQVKGTQKRVKGVRNQTQLLLCWLWKGAVY